MTELIKINTKFSTNTEIAVQQEKRYRNALLLKSRVFLKESCIIDKNIYYLFRVYNKDTKQTYTVQVEYPFNVYIQNIYASCDCPDFVQRASKYSIACKHILKSIQALKNDNYIDLTSMNLIKRKAEEVKINYLDIPCPKCSSKAVLPFKKLSCIFYENNKDAEYVCESCYHCW